MKTWLVYWLHDKRHRSPKMSGYIGVTCNFSDRMRIHKKRFGDQVCIDVIFKGTENQCYKMEAELRPKPAIGWNVAAGGPQGYHRGHYLNLGKKRTVEQRQHLSEAHKNQKRSKASTIKSLKTRKKNGTLYPAAMIEASKQSWLTGNRVSGMTGKRHSKETIKKMRLAALRRKDGMITFGFKGKQHSDKTKTLIRVARAAQSVEPHLGCKHSAETKATLSVIAKNIDATRQRDHYGRYTSRRM